ncbi:DoxX family protein [Polynucleobacter sp. Latsch14-2]|jgi:putative oxidoreductase|uniref:DoxX family protein n=1 Tax=Polynucleobacter sp. Latsch14-2 TaxID=2576920 RepID=UPI001C0AC300|nr:DoxX family protein [Polynucleobacter sp. Latsch14-2]MBU3614894.1 DoxX family protein [Polynucleobacter sp. Latsch14-2]
MKTYQNALNLLGRLLIVALFLPAGLGKIAGFEGTLGYFASLGIPAPTFALAATIVIEVLGGIALLIGFQTRLVAGIMAIFTLVAAVTGHAYWAAPVDQAFIAQLLFFKNIAVMGGLLVLASAGAGGFSVDGRKESK